MPAKAGIQGRATGFRMHGGTADWIPAFAGMTTSWIGTPVLDARQPWQSLVSPAFLAVWVKLSRTAVGQARA